jgi:inositol oxygenase
MTLRIYEKNTKQFNLYLEMYKNQTIDLVKSKREEYGKLNKAKMTIHEALKMLDSFVDPSDPDLDVPNSIHAYQTAERIRKKYPDDKEFQIIGLIHDLGKVLFSFGEESWCVVGDTYVLGCEIPESIVYYENTKKYNELCIYKKGCGLDNLIISYGHDEYLYSVLKGNKNHKISQKYMDVIRFHSFYPWHTNGEYKEFLCEKDSEILKNVKKFNEFDLYSKEDSVEITEKTKEYYKELLDDYFDDELKW